MKKIIIGNYFKMKKLLSILIIFLASANLTYGAIARDASSATTATSSSTVNKTLYVSYTVTAGSTNRLLVAIGFEWNGTQSITSVTYASTTMTLGQATPTNADGETSYVYFLDNPASGTNNVVVNGVTNELMHGNLVAHAQNYTGVKQTGTADAIGGNKGATASTMTGTVITVANNSWAVMSGYNTGGSLVASTNATSVSNSGGSMMADNQTYGPITPAGSFSETITSASGNWTWAMMSFEPDIPVAAATGEEYTIIFD